MMPRLFDTVASRDRAMRAGHVTLSSEEDDAQITPRSGEDWSDGDARCRAQEEKWHYGLLPQ